MRDGFLGLGGNLGDPLANMAQALRALNDHGDVEIVAVSRAFRTPPWGRLDQPWFVNACAHIRTRLEAHALLDLCLETERALKRERGERWGPRTLDIDILILGSISLSDGRLTLPHARMGERAFVLAPLSDLAPELSIGGRGVRQRLAALDAGGIEPVGPSRDWWRASGLQG